MGTDCSLYLEILTSESHLALFFIPLRSRLKKYKPIEKSMKTEVWSVSPYGMTWDGREIGSCSLFFALIHGGLLMSSLELDTEKPNSGWTYFWKMHRALLFLFIRQNVHRTEIIPLAHSAQTLVVTAQMHIALRAVETSSSTTSENHT